MFADNVLIDGSLAGHAAAQTTASTYCDGLAPVSCEILNVNLVGGWSVNGVTNGFIGACLITYCRNRQLSYIPCQTQINSSQLGMMVFNNSNGVVSTGRVNGDPSRGGATQVATVWSNANLCGALP